MSLKIRNTKLSGCFLIEFERSEDSRGWFQRGFDQFSLNELGFTFSPLQANFANTLKAGTVRGLHFQEAPFGEDKLFHCIKGSVFDVAVDLRENSPTYGEWFGTVLEANNASAIYIPKGFAHGYMSLEDDVTVVYFVSQVYNSQSEKTVSFLNEELRIKWPLTMVQISEKDLAVSANDALPNTGY